MGLFRCALAFAGLGIAVVLPLEAMAQAEARQVPESMNTATITVPEMIAPGKPWVWEYRRGFIPPPIRQELLHHGWHVATAVTDNEKDHADFIRYARDRKGLAPRDPVRYEEIGGDLFRNALALMQDSYVLPGDREYYTLRGGLGNCLHRFAREKKGRIAFLGGSITYNKGWRDEMIRYFTRRFPYTEFDFISTGIPSMGSVPHAFRFSRDVLKNGPVDLLLVEAAVNDASNTPGDTEKFLRGMEGVVRHARQANPLIDIVEMHFVMPAHMDDYTAGKAPAVIVEHERVAEHYGTVSLDLAREVTDRIAAGHFSWAKDFKNLHPSPYGQRVYANSMTRMFEAAFAEAEGRPARPHALPEQPLDAFSYFDGRFGDITTAVPGPGFRVDPNWKPKDGKGTRAGYVRVPALVGETPGAGFSFSFTGRGAGLLITSGPDAADIEFRVDGGAFQRISTRTRWSGGLHLPWALMLDDELEAGDHTVEVRLPPDQEKGALRVFQLLLN